MSDLLVVVHPGSCCGSASYSLGRVLAAEYRDALILELNQWTGDVLVVDGDLSDELPAYPALNAAIIRALERAPVGRRVFACDDVGEHFTTLLPRLIADSPWAKAPHNTHAYLTGAWFDHEGRSGCVNATGELLDKLGISREILDSAFPVGPATVE